MYAERRVPDPQGFWNLLEKLPWHADTLLQVAEVHRHREGIVIPCSYRQSPFLTSIQNGRRQWTLWIERCSHMNDLSLAPSTLQAVKTGWILTA